jgi:hypothetical protein
MNQQTFKYRVVYTPFASIRINLVPKPGSLELDNNGILSLINTADGKAVIQKPFNELQAVRQQNFGLFGKPVTAIIYVAINEAYEIVFTSENPVLSSGVEIYQELLQGHRDAAIEQFKRNNIAKANKTDISKAMKEGDNDYRNFLAAAKQAGVYESIVSSLSFIAGAMLFAGVSLVIIVAYIVVHNS